MIFIDTGPIVARYLRRDQFHFSAVSSWKKIEGESATLVLSSLVFAESINLLARRADPSFAAARASAILHSGEIEILRPSSVDEERALEIMTRYSDQRVSFTDCVSFALMKAHGIRRVFSFDRHFDLLGFERFPLN